jgi:putative SOS response-associated peptidase YedK
MCYQYSFNKPTQSLTSIAKAKPLDFIEWQPKVDAISGDFMPIITNEFSEVIQYFKWGLVPVWAKDIGMGRNMYNTKMENLLEKTSLQAIFRYKRCILPATSFRIWRDKNKKESKEIVAPTNSFFFMCGLWDVWGEGLQSFSVLTHQPFANNPELNYPYLIDINQKEKWLNKYAETMKLFDKVKPIVYPV